MKYACAACSWSEAALRRGCQWRQLRVHGDGEKSKQPTSFLDARSEEADYVTECYQAVVSCYNNGSPEWLLSRLVHLYQILMRIIQL
jgi:hypothetical protein